MKTYIIAYNYTTIDIEAKSEKEAIKWFETEVQSDWDHIWEEEVERCC
jgi:hypothetical protein